MSLPSALVHKRAHPDFMRKTLVEMSPSCKSVVLAGTQMVLCGMFVSSWCIGVGVTLRKVKQKSEKLERRFANRHLSFDKNVISL